MPTSAIDSASSISGGVFLAAVVQRSLVSSSCCHWPSDICCRSSPPPRPAQPTLPLRFPATAPATASLPACLCVLARCANISRPLSQCHSKQPTCTLNRRSFHPPASAPKCLRFHGARSLIDRACTPPFAAQHHAQSLASRSLASRILVLCSPSAHLPSPCSARPPPYRFYSSSPSVCCCCPRCPRPSSRASPLRPTAASTSACWATARMASATGL